jgi:DNA-binding NtrC family response regulator
LRVLERKEVRRVGSNQYVPADCRVIAATSRSLRADVNARKFRADLFYRLAVVQVRLPPLRERLEDLPQLVDAFSGELGSDILRSPELLGHLDRHSWPGNVRELRNYLERCVALGEVAPLAPAEAPGDPSIDPQQPIRTQREQWIRHFERRYLEELLRVHDGNVSAAARGAGMDRPSFYRLLWKHGLR